MDKRTLYIAAALQGLCANPDTGIFIADDNELPGEIDVITGRAIEIADAALTAESLHFEDAPGPDVIVVDHLAAGQPHTKAVFIDVDDPRARPIVDAVRHDAAAKHAAAAMDDAAIQSMGAQLLRDRVSTREGTVQLLAGIHDVVAQVAFSIRLRPERLAFEESRLLFLLCVLKDFKEPTNG